MTLSCVAYSFGPLIEVPVMIGLVSVAFWLQRRWFKHELAAAPATVVATAAEACPPAVQELAVERKP